MAKKKKTKKAGSIRKVKYGSLKKYAPDGLLKRCLVNLLLLAGSIVIMLVFLEIALRIFLPQTLSISTFDSRYGLELKPNVSVMQYGKHFVREFAVEVRTNSDGLREYAEHGYGPDRGDKFRVLMLGDSFTFGSGVELKETFAKILEMQMKNNGRNAEVINFGVPGTELSEYYARLKYKGVKYEPDAVVVGLFLGNDLRKLETERFKPDVPNEIPYWIASKSHAFVFSYVLAHSYGRNLLNMMKNYTEVPLIYTPQKEEYSEVIDSFESAMLDFKKLAEENKFKIMFVVIPTRGQVDDLRWQDFLNNAGSSDGVERFKIEEDLKMVFEKTGMSYIDLTPYFVKLNKNNSFYYQIDGHFNKEGHKVAAAVLYKEMGEEGLIE